VSQKSLLRNRLLRCLLLFYVYTLFLGHPEKRDVHTSLEKKVDVNFTSKIKIDVSVTDECGRRISLESSIK